MELHYDFYDFGGVESMAADLSKIEEHAKSISEREGCVFYDMEVSGAGNSRILRIFIDKDTEEGVTIKDCSNVSRALDLILDVEDLMEGGAFNLEVSSPGLERRLSKPWHFEKAAGQTVRIQMLEPLSEAKTGNSHSKARKKVVGVLGPVDEGCIEVVPEEQKKSSKVQEQPETLRIPLENIKKAQIVFDFSKGYTPKR